MLIILGDSEKTFLSRKKLIAQEFNLIRVRLREILTSFVIGFNQMGKKNIVFFIHSMSSGGAERVVSILSDSLAKTFNVFIITVSDTPSFYKLNVDVKLVSCGNELNSGNGIFTAIKSNYFIYRSILKILKVNRIDLCIGFMTSCNILATLASKRLHIPVIICERNNPHLESVSLNSFWKILRRFIYPMADLLIVQTQRVKTFYTSFIDSQKLVTVPNPINPDFNRDFFCRKENVILNVGRLESQKGQDTLIRAFYQANIKNWRLHIIGEGSQRPNLEKLIEGLGLQERVYLLGKRSNIAEYYASSKVFAFSSRYEGFPNALLEAMYFGLPCVSTDCPTGPAEMIDNDLNGYLVPVDDTDQMAQKLKMIAKDNALQVGIGKAAQTAVEPFQIEQILIRWNTLIQRLL